MKRTSTHSPGHWVLAGLLLTLGFIFAYAATLGELYHFWFHGFNWRFFVPILFVYMLWHRRGDLNSLPAAPSWAVGVVALLFATGLLIVGQISSTHALREVSFFSALGALLLLVWGKQRFPTFSVPLFYLLLTTSLVDRMLFSLQAPLKRISAVVADATLSTLGFSVIRNANILRLPHSYIEVADSCSGVGQLISMIALAVPIAYTTQKKTSKHAILLALAIALALVLNWMRVILIALWHYGGQKESIHGPGEIYSLPFIFLGGLVILIAAARILGREPNMSKESNGEPRFAPRRGDGLKAMYTAAAILTATGAFLHLWKIQPTSLMTDLQAFPMEIGGWRGKDLDSLPKPFTTGVADHEVLRRYTNRNGTSAIVYLGFFPLQNQEKELVDSRYQWLHTNARPEKLTSESGDTIRIKHSRANGINGNKLDAYFFYNINGNQLVDAHTAKLASIRDALMYRRTGGGIAVAAFTAENTPPKERVRFLRRWATLAYHHLREKE
ncbi:MAG: EpsI family protein [Chitinivibrionales bacterium]|nr:EpsI family protein [Chitinivibrionales bacterium]MBD3355840.1 EpsI family protein [Chitinivibrionales bacterium]